MLVALGAFVAEPGAESGRPGDAVSWAGWGSNPQRTFHQPDPGRVASLAYAPWTLRHASIPNSSGTDFLAVAVGDLGSPPGLEMVVTRAIVGFTGENRIEAWSSSGDLLWFHTSEYGTTPPLLLDINADGIAEVYYASRYTHWLLDHRGKVLWERDYTLHEVPVCGTTCSYPTAFDVTGDGVPDILVSGDPDTHTLVALDGRDGALLWKYRLRCGWVVLPAVGIRIDGTPAVLAGCESGPAPKNTGGAQVHAFRTVPRALPPAGAASPSGLLTAATTEDLWGVAFEPPGSMQNILRYMLVAEVTGDGVPDIVLAHRDPFSLRVLSLHGEQQVHLKENSTRFPNTIGAGDLDGDGVMEVLVNHLRGVAAYSFLGPPRLLWDTLGDAPTTGSNAGTADLDGDGRDEVIAAFHRGSYCAQDDHGYFAVLGQHGQVRWRSEPLPRCTAGVRAFALADLDLDGDIEFVWPALKHFKVFGVGPQPTGRTRG